MPSVDIHVAGPPERVFAVLARPGTYADWVVGSRAVRDADPSWPATGSRFAHEQGRWPLVIDDETEVVASDPPWRLELIAKVRPVLVARVILDLQPEAGGTRVTMEEQPVGGAVAPLLRLPGGSLLTRLRNFESLRRLRRLAERDGASA
jgi:uncharacterized protein YndB with AHSA1/START domain